MDEPAGVELVVDGEQQQVVVAVTELMNVARARNGRVFMDDPSMVAEGRGGGVLIRFDDVSDPIAARAIVGAMLDQIPGGGSVIRFR